MGQSVGDSRFRIGQRRRRAYGQRTDYAIIRQFHVEASAAVVESDAHTWSVVSGPLLVVSIANRTAFIFVRGERDFQGLGASLLFACEGTHIIKHSAATDN